MKISMKIMTALAIFAMCCSGAFVMVNDGDNSDATINETDGLDYTVADGCLTISGTGPMTDYPWNASLVTLYTFSTCIIESGVTSIGNYAFYECLALTSITISDSVVSIGTYVFKDCSALTSISIPNGVGSIGECAFFGCSSLPSMLLPDSVVSIGEMAFYACSSFTSITIPDSVVSIDDNAFNGCCNVTSVTFNGLQPTFGSDSMALGYVIHPAIATMNTSGWGSASVFISDVIGNFTTLTYVSMGPVTYTVTFDAGTSDVTVPASQTIESGSCATIPDLSVDGYTVAWYSDSGLTIPFDFTSVITANTTLYLGLTAVSVDPSDLSDIDSNDSWYFDIGFLIVILALSFIVIVSIKRS